MSQKPKRKLEIEVDDHRRGPVQEAPQDHDSRDGDRPPVRGVARDAAERRGRARASGRGVHRGSWSSSGSGSRSREQVKSNLLMSSLEQIDKEYKLEPITQPRLDIEAIEIPETGR